MNIYLKFIPLHLYMHKLFILFSDEEGTVYARIQGGYVIVGIQVTNDEPMITCEHAAYGSTAFVDFPLEGGFGYFNGYSECPAFIRPINRINFLNSIIKITWKGKVLISDVATAISLGAFNIICTTDNSNR